MDLRLFRPSDRSIRSLVIPSISPPVGHRTFGSAELLHEKLVDFADLWITFASKTFLLDGFFVQVDSGVHLHLSLGPIGNGVIVDGHPKEDLEEAKAAARQQLKISAQLERAGIREEQLKSLREKMKDESRRSSSAESKRQLMLEDFKKSIDPETRLEIK